MKKIIAVFLVCCLILTACGQKTSNTENTQSKGTGEKTSKSDLDYQEIVPDYESLSDPELLRYVEDNVYRETVKSLDNDKYFVQNVKATYVSKEYLEELSYNSKSNIFFGYTLAELDDEFQGTRYVFTLGEDGSTTVEPFEEYDDTYERTIKNVAIGSGVILVCVTVSVVTGGAGVPAVSMILATSAKTGAVMALSSGAIGGVSAGIMTGIQTNDFNEALKAGALAGSEAFKWGAISGAISGGATEAIALKGATLNGLTMNEAAAIQKESKYPLDVIKQFSSTEQYEICKEAGLTSKMVNGKASLIREIDLNYVDEKGLTNLERMQKGLSAIDPESGLPYELHHIGQEMDSTLAILTEAEHMQGGNNAIWHSLGEASKIDRAVFAAQRKAYWKALANMMAGGV